MAKKARRFNYEKRSADDVKERANARGGQFDSIFKPQYKVYKVKDGKNVLRIMPKTWEGPPKHYGYDIYVNYGIGVDNASYLSLSKMLGEKDPLAEARRMADKEGDEEVAKALAPKQRVVMWVIDRDNESEGPQLWPAPFTVDKDLASLSVDEDTNEVVLLDDPEEGCDFRFYREGKGRNTKYPAAKMRLLKPSPLCEDEDLQEEWRAFTEDNPIPDCLQYYSYKQIAEAYGGNVRVDKDDDDEDRPRRKRRPADDEEEEAPRRARRPRDDDDGDQVPWKGRRNGREKDDDEEAEAEAPRRTRRARDEEVDEPPPRKARRAARDDDGEAPEDEEAAAPRQRTRIGRRAAEPDDDAPEDDASPPRRAARRQAKAEADEADDDDDEYEAPPPPKGGLRDRIAQRRAAVTGKSRD